MTSDPTHVDEAFVWIWLPGSTSPVVAGRARMDGALLTFTYGRSYLAHPAAIPIYSPELPLEPGVILPPPGSDAPGCLLDSGPDAWGQRIILDQLTGQHGRDAATESMSQLTYLMHAGSDRIGALDFQRSATDYAPRDSPPATLEQLQQAAELIDRRDPLPPDLATVLLRGTSIGGARPKALVDAPGRKLVAKFSSTTDPYPVVQAEFAAMELARRCGLHVAPVELVEVLGRQALLVERFDREPAADGWTRRALVSALTLLGLPEQFGRHATYFELARIIQERFTTPRATLHELFARITFNILCSNGDDHARNHAAFWDGHQLTLTPAYDICPGLRLGASPQNQAMAIAPGRADGRLATCLEHAAIYDLAPADARAIIDHQLDVIRRDWHEVADQARLATTDRDSMWQRQFLNPYALEGYGPR